MTRYVGVIAAILTLAFPGLLPQARAADQEFPTVLEAHLTEHGNVALTRSNGQKVMLTSQGRCVEVLVAKDRQTVAWTRTTEGGSIVFIYRNGVVKRIKGDPFVRGIWFLDGGNKIGIDSGGMHFAGVEILYDVATLKELDHVSQTVPTSERPSWSESSDVYVGEQ